MKISVLSRLSGLIFASFVSFNCFSGSGTGVSGGSYHEIDFKILPDEIVLEKMLHHSEIREGLWTHCGYHLVNFKDSDISNDTIKSVGVPWEFFIRRTIKITKDRDLFRSQEPHVEHQIFGRLNAHSPWLEVKTRLVDNFSEKNCRDGIIFNLGRTMVSNPSTWIDYHQAPRYQSLAFDELKNRLSVIQMALARNIDVTRPETFGYYMSFAKIVAWIDHFCINERVNPEWDETGFFGDDVRKRTSVFIAEAEGFKEGETPEQMQKFLNDFDGWATRAEIWSLGSQEWIRQFELKSQTKLSSKMKSVLSESASAVDSKLARLAIRAERVRRVLDRSQRKPGKNEKTKIRLKIENE